MSHWVGLLVNGNSNPLVNASPSFPVPHIPGREDDGLDNCCLALNCYTSYWTSGINCELNVQLWPRIYRIVNRFEPRSVRTMDIITWPGIDGIFNRLWSGSIGARSVGFPKSVTTSDQGDRLPVVGVITIETISNFLRQTCHPCSSWQRCL